MQWQNEKEKMTNNYLHNTTQKTKDWETQTAQIIGGELGCSGRVGSLSLTYPIVNQMLETV